MDKLLQIIWAYQCWNEFETVSKRKTKVRGINAVKGWLEELLGDLLMFVILSYGITKGWVKIPTVLGDGYDYDSFNHE